MDFIEDTTRRNFVCRHVWHVSDLVLWNKRCTPIEACRSTLPAHDGQDRPHVATQTIGFRNVHPGCSHAVCWF
jgi:hypothetical protein